MTTWWPLVRAWLARLRNPASKVPPAKAKANARNLLERLMQDEGLSRTQARRVIRRFYEESMP